MAVKDSISRDDCSSDQGAKESDQGEVLHLEVVEWSVLWVLGIGYLG